VMSESKPAIGYIGTGLMGAPMTRRLLDAGFPVTIWNRTAGKMAPLLEAGAIEASGPRAVAEQSDIVMMCLTAAPAVEAVVFGDGGVAETDGAGKVLVDFSSMRPDLTAEFAGRLKEANGMGWIDAPVSGGVPGAEQGTLAIMAGGEKADFDKVAPVVAHVSARFTHMGPSGAGQVTKLCNQIISGGTFVLVAEAVALAQRCGVDATRLPEALSGGFADSKPFQILAPRYATQTYDPPLGQLYTIVKDFDTIWDQARSVDLNVPMSSQVLTLFRQLMNRGHGDDDITTLMKLYDSEPLP